MTGLCSVTLDQRPGLPADGAKGFFVGWDEDGKPYMLWWSGREVDWVCVSGDDRAYPEMYYAPPLIVRHAKLPEPP